MDKTKVRAGSTVESGDGWGRRKWWGKWRQLYLTNNKEKNKQMGSHKIQSFCMAKENISKMKREPTVWENMFANDTSDKGLISKIYKELT